MSFMRFGETMKKILGIIATCSCCPWRCEDYLIAKDEAIKHSKKGHSVDIEITGLVTYLNGEVQP